MTDQQAAQFIQAAAEAFTELSNYFSRDGIDRARLARSWCRALADVDDSTAWDVLNDMIAGKLETPRWGWGQFPALVRGHCTSRRGRPYHRATKESRLLYDGPPLTELVARKLAEQPQLAARAWCELSAEQSAERK